MDRYTVAETVGLYEINYKRLVSLFPRLREMDGPYTLAVNIANRIQLDIVERCPYTMVIDLSHDFASPSQWVHCPSMRLRVYYDAEVVEVISYQGHYRFDHRYDYPNKKMLYRHEKRVVNLFLGEWLEHCLLSWQGNALPASLTSS